MTKPTVTGGQATTVADLQREIQLLRAGLLECYVIAGGDPESYREHDIASADLVPLVVDCVRDLRGFFNAARRDMR